MIPYRPSLRRTCSAVMPEMRNSFRGFVIPLTSSTPRRGDPSAFASIPATAVLARPFSGAAEVATFNASPRTPTILSRLEPGTTLTDRTTPPATLRMAS